MDDLPEVQDDFEQPNPASTERFNLHTIWFMILYLEEEAGALGMEMARNLLAAAALDVQEQIITRETRTSYINPPRLLS